MRTDFPAMIEFDINSEPKAFELDFSICENPYCDCNGVSMTLYSKEKRLQFFLDFNSESFREENHSQEDRTILESFIEFLKKSPSITIPFFKQNYRYVKDKARKSKEAIESFELGTFLTYGDIIWEEDDLMIDVEGKNYVVFDGYCVTPDCGCTEAALNFFEEVHKLGVRKPDFSFVYDYGTGNYRDSVGIKDIQMQEIIQNFPHRMNSKLHQRHISLKKKVKKDIEKKIEEKEFFPQKRRKIGRNEPCPCGSGKKYKKCCLE